MTSQHPTSRIRIPLIAACAIFGAAGVAAAADGDAEYSVFTDLAFWTLPTFILFVITIRKLGWASFVGGLAEREKNENRLIGEAEQARREAEELLREHRGRLEAVDEDIRELIAKAHRDAEYTRQDIVASARSESETLKQRALREIERARDQALDEIFVTFNDRVIAATEERIRDGLTPRDHDRLIEAALGEFAASAG